MRAYFRQALFADTLRGYDSTGMFHVSRTTKEVSKFKRAMPAYDFLEHHKVDNIINNIHANKFSVGHNRWKTRGAPNNRNAHPFQHGDITLVHNGTLSSYSFLCNERFDTDSETICKALSNVEPDDVQEVIKELDGSFTLVWYDKRIDALRIIRNEERPINIGVCKNANAGVIASEVGMLRWITGRLGIGIQSVSSPKPGMLLSYYDDAAKPDVKEMKLYEKKTYSYGKGGASYAGSGLKRLGIDPDGFIKVIPLHWEPYSKKYNNAGTGTLYVYSDKHPNVSFRISNTVYKGYSCQKYLMAKPSYLAGFGENEYVALIHVRETGEYIPKKDRLGKEEVYDSAAVNDDRKEEKKGKVISLPSPQEEPSDDRPFRNAEGEYISEKKFHVITSGGCCSICGSPIQKDEGSDIMWDAYGNVYCSTCYNTHEEYIQV